jgi:hypothetical protein
VVLVEMAEATRILRWGVQLYFVNVYWSGESRTAISKDTHGEVSRTQIDVALKRERFNASASHVDQAGQTSRALSMNVFSAAKMN